MTKTLAAVDRVLVFLLGFLLTVAGLIPALLYFDVPYISSYVDKVDRSVLSTLADARWFPYVLVAGFVLTLLAGLWIVLANVRSRALSYFSITPARTDHGETDLNVQRIAQAACDYLSAAPGVGRADHSVAMVGRRPTATFTVTMNPDVSLVDATHLIESAGKDFAAACGAMDIDTVYKLHFESVRD